MYHRFFACMLGVYSIIITSGEIEGGAVLDQIGYHVQANPYLLSELAATIEHEHPTWNYGALTKFYCFFNQKKTKRSVLPVTFIRALWHEIRKEKARRIVVENDQALQRAHRYQFLIPNYMLEIMQPLFFCTSMTLLEHEQQHDIDTTQSIKQWWDITTDYGGRPSVIEDGFKAYKQRHSEKHTHHLKKLFLALIDDAGSVDTFMYDTASDLFLHLRPVPQTTLEGTPGIYKSMLLYRAYEAISSGNFSFMRTLSKLCK